MAGPGTPTLEQEWKGSFKQTLHRLDEAFGSAVETVLLDLRNYSESWAANPHLQHLSTLVHLTRGTN